MRERESRRRRVIKGVAKCIWVKTKKKKLLDKFCFNNNKIIEK